MIKIENLCKSFDNGKTFAVNPISLRVEDGKTLMLVGSSGCGKSTLLKMINRLIAPTSGLIEVDGKNISDIDIITLRRAIGYVFQSIGLFPHMTVEENIAIVLQLQNVSKKIRTKRAHELLETVNLNPATFARRYPDELSGGQQQRVGVARSLANNPKYLLMDEPFGAVDPINRETLQNEIAALRDRLGKTVIFVTHDIVEAIRLGDTIAVMNKGRIVQAGTSEDIIKNPINEFVFNLFQTVRKSKHDV